MNEQQARDRWRRVFERAHSEFWRLVCDFATDGLLVAAVRDERTVVAHCRAARAMSPFHATAGTHERCEVRLPDDDPNVDVRHVVIRYDALEAGRASLAAFDLDTTAGFEIENGEARRAVAAVGGPLFLRIGTFDVMALPIMRAHWSPDAAVTWRSFAARAFIGERPLFSPVAAARSRINEPRRAAGSDERTDVSWSRPPRRLRPARERGGSPVRGVLAFNEGGDRIERRITASDATRGILVGRFPRCSFRGAAGTLSRIHLAVFDIAGSLWAIDTSSTNGTTRGGTPVRACILEDGATLRLASACELTFGSVEAHS